MSTAVLTFCSPKYEFSSMLTGNKKLTVVKTKSITRSMTLNEEELERFIPNKTTTYLCAGIKTQLYKELEMIYQNGQDDEWMEFDDECFDSIKDFSYNQAKSFIDFLDDTIQKPAIVANSNGTIGFQLCRNNKISSINFNRPGKFIFTFIDNNTSNQQSKYQDYTFSALMEIVEILKREFYNEK